ncbi:MAG: putative molybdenum cofactor guanylyltransferase [Candidatus Binatia bacterium]|nr:MAG: putative molybdenum cofactor guanylyltransferase [Candidatus Binatia bacterium]
MPDSPLTERATGVILAGGKNSRMGGREKAFLRVEGRTILERTVELLRRAFPDVLVVANAPEKYAAFGVRVVRDEIPGAGPLGGIHAALGAVATPYVFAVACDMPYLRLEPIAHLLGYLRDQEAVIPEWEGDIEPLHAFYATRIRVRIEGAIARGVRSIRDFLPAISVTYVSESEMRSVEGAAESFCNVNTPEDAARFRVVAEHPSC